VFSDHVGWQRQQLMNTLSTIFGTLLRRVYEVFQTHDSISTGDVALLTSTLYVIHSNPLFTSGVADFLIRIEELREALRTAAAHQYFSNTESTDTDEHAGPLDTLLRLLDWIKATTKSLSRKFNTPLLESVLRLSVILSLTDWG
jgi:hypothetical protein